MSTQPIQWRPTAPSEPPAALTDTQRAALKRLLGRMIPASERFVVPGADDETIFADVLVTGNNSPAVFERALTRLDALAQGSWAQLDAAAQDEVIDRFGGERSPPLLALMNLVAQCYYRDDRVMLALGMEARAPYPYGYEIEASDWSLLEPVRARGKRYRDAP